MNEGQEAWLVTLHKTKLLDFIKRCLQTSYLTYKAMSASKFERKKQLKEPLLRAGEEASSRPEAELEESSHNSSSDSLHSSRRTLNHSQEPRRSRTLDFEGDVELSPTRAMSGIMSVNRAGEVPYLAYKEEEEEEEGEDQQGSDDDDTDKNSSDDELLLAGDNFSINRYSGEFKTLPRPYNPGERSDAI